MAKRPKLRRVPGSLAHGEVQIFAVCSGPWHMAKFKSLPCARIHGTRRTSNLAPSPRAVTVTCGCPCCHVLYFAVCQPKHMAKCFAVCPIKGTRRSWLCCRGWSPSRIRHGPRAANMYAVCFGAFAVCFGHTTNGQNPVVSGKNSPRKKRVQQFDLQDQAQSLGLWDPRVFRTTIMDHDSGSRASSPCVTS